MTRRYGELIEVRRRDDAPAEFLWRGRLYVVREVLAHWAETRAWWRGPAARAVLSIDDPAPMSAGDPAVSVGDVPVGSAPAGSAASMATGSLDQERDLWRVEASAGRLHGSGVYELSFDWSTGAWSLVRALD